MAKIGTTFQSKYPYHSQLEAASPLVVQITGEKQFRPKEAPTFFFKVQGDPEGEYGIKPAGTGDTLKAYYAAMVGAPQGTWLKMTAAGREKDKTDDTGKITQKGNACTIVFEPVEGGGLPEQPETQPEAEPQAPESPATGDALPWEDEASNAAPEAPQATPKARPTNGKLYPYPTMAEAYLEALRASYLICQTEGLPLDPSDTESLRAIAATLVINQKEIHRAIGYWIPIR